MGIRMHLSVGYALDLTIMGGADKTKLAFERLEDDELFEAWKEDVLSYAEKHDELIEKYSLHPNMNPPTALYQMIVSQTEGEIDKILLIPAGQHENWSRYGNLLDAFLYEAQLGDFDKITMVDEWIEHPGTLYPYIGLMKPNPDMPLGVEKFWVPCYKDHPKFKHATAWAPWHLWFLIKHLGLWPEDRTTEAFLSLRPSIYRHWG